jgi:ParB family transcriptional regulator, chromosome partitioning protein
MNRRSGLGRGLGSLIPHAGAEPDDTGTPALTEIAVAAISPNPNQPRLHFDEESLGELADSIAQLGLLQPILVRRVDDGYQLIAGERRWRAARRAGLTTVPAVVRVADDINAVEEALVENLHREDLTALEEAAAYLQLIEEFELTHEDVAKRIGKSRSSVTNALRLLSLPPEVQRLLADGKLSAGHAKALLGTPDRALQERLATLAVEEGWSVRTTEEVVRAGGVRPADPQPASEPQPPGPAERPEPTATRLRPPGLLELEELLASHLDTRVGVQMGSKRGRVSIEFADLEDLERIYRLIVE